MTIQQSLAEVLVTLDNATNAIAARLDVLTTQISTGMTQADVDQVVSTLQSEAQRLNSLASDPSNPVPSSEPA